MENILGEQKALLMNYPEITSYPPHANLLSILSHNEDNLYWFCNNYLPLAIDKESYYLDFIVGYCGIYLFKYCPLITFHGLDGDFIKNNWNSFIDFIIKSINSGYYLSFFVDRYYIPVYKNYMKHHHIHQLLVFGYNKAEQSLNIADFIINGKYYFTTCNFNDIEKGYAAANNTNSSGECFLLKENQVHHSLNIHLIKNHIEDYLSSENSSKSILLTNEWMADNKYAYGVKVYDILEEYIINISKKITNRFDQRIFHTLWDHKKYILMLIKCLNKQGYLYNSDYYYRKFLFIAERALQLRNLMLKYTISDNYKIIDRAINILKELAYEEPKVLAEMLDNIN